MGDKRLQRMNLKGLNLLRKNINSEEAQNTIPEDAAC